MSPEYLQPSLSNSRQENCYITPLQMHVCRYQNIFNSNNRDIFHPLFILLHLSWIKGPKIGEIETILIKWHEDPLPSIKPCPGLQPHCCSVKKTNMDNVDGNLLTFVSKVSKPIIIIRNENLKSFKISELRAPMKILFHQILKC